VCVGGRGACTSTLARPRRALVQGDPEHPEDLIALVGKGITYDTGGLNLKPTGGIENMRACPAAKGAEIAGPLASHAPAAPRRHGHVRLSCECTGACLLEEVGGRH